MANRHPFDIHVDFRDVWTYLRMLYGVCVISSVIGIAISPPPDSQPLYLVGMWKAIQWAMLFFIASAFWLLGCTSGIISARLALATNSAAIASERATEEL